MRLPPGFYCSATNLTYIPIPVKSSTSDYPAFHRKAGPSFLGLSVHETSNTYGL